LEQSEDGKANAVLSRLWSSKYTVKCPDGTTRTVYHRVEDVFPLQLKYAKRSAAASVSALNKLKASTEYSRDEQISAVLTGIDRINQSIQSHFRAIYAVYEASPCTELPYFKVEIQRIIMEEQKLRSVETVISQACSLASKANISGDSSVSNAINGMLSQALQMLLPPPAAALVVEMGLVEDRTKRWSEGG
jgi:hypothetical protein